MDHQPPSHSDPAPPRPDLEPWGADTAVERADVDALIETLRTLRSRACAMLIVGRVLALLGAAIAIATALGLIDFALRLPEWLRIILLLGGVAVFIREAWLAASPAWRFAPSLTDLALRIERRTPELRGVLASAVDFADDARRAEAGGRREAPIARALSAMVVHRAVEKWRSTDHSGVFRGRKVFVRAGWCAAALAVCMTLLVASPLLWSIGARRVLTPWTGAAWPKRTGVLDATTQQVHALGMALPLQAIVTQSNRAWDSTYVAVRFRLLGAGATTERRELLTYQNREQSLADAPDVQGALFERLIEPVGQAVEYRFETEDDQTEWRTIRLIEPPAVLSAQATITPPDYARASILAADTDPAQSALPANLAMGPGTDDRAVAPPALAGSTVDLTITLNRPLPIPESVRSLFMDPEEEIAASESAAQAQPTLTADGETWRIRWRLDDSLRLPIALRDEYGIESVEQAVYRFEAQTDRPAAATITEPGADRTALATATLNVVGEGRDDVGLAWVRVDRQIYKPAGAPGRERSGPGGAMEPAEEPATIATADIAGLGQGSAAIDVALAELSLQPGDEVRFTALALDLLSASTGADPTISPVRTVRIISEAQLIAEIQGALTDIRQTAIRIEEQQARLLERTERGVGDSQARRGQAQITERLARQGESVRRLSERIRENALSDQGLQELLSRADTTLNDAGRSSARASQALDDAAESPQGAPTQPDSDAQSPDTEPQDQSSDSGASQPRQGQSNSGAQQSGASGQQGQQGEQGQQGQQGQQSQQGQTGQQGESGQQGQQGQQGQSGQQGESGQQGQQGQQGAEQPQQDEEPQPADPLAPNLNEQDQQAVADAQRQTQEQVRSLIEMLDRGEDDWVVRNNIERLIREQKELREKTQETGRKTAGRDVDQLSPQEKSDIAQIAEMQNRLAQQTKELLDDMREREKKLSEKDPAAAKGMSQAAQRAQSEQIEQTMRNAAGDAAQNQTASASRQQQQAQESLEEMLEDLNAGDRARDETLRRALASIIETLEALVGQQQQEITLLDEVIRERKAYTGLDARMIRLNQNTIGVFDFIKSQSSELAPVANLVGRASEAQSAAIRDLRNLVVVSKAVRGNEERSLDFLKQALDKANSIDKQVQERQRQKKLAELKKRYRELLEQQVAIRAETEPLAALPELSRRDRVLARGLADRQTTVRDSLAAMLRDTAELSDAKVFEYAHKRLDERTARAASALTDARLTDAVHAEKLAEAALRTVIESLNDPPPDEDKFSKQEESGGGGGGGGGGQEPLIPPVKELLLLKGMQGGLAERTAELNRMGAEASRAEIEALGREQRDLMQVGADFIERLQSEGQGPPLTPEAPDAQPPEQPAPQGEPQ